MFSGANNTRFGIIKDHLTDQMLLEQGHCPKNIEDIVGLLNCWKGPSAVKNTTTDIPWYVAIVQFGKNEKKNPTKAVHTFSTVVPLNTWQVPGYHRGAITQALKGA